jgi:DNA-binding NarL/FixJ family response regulator
MGYESVRVRDLRHSGQLLAATNGATLTDLQRRMGNSTYGLTNAEIAQRLYVGEGTAKTHVTRILTKLDLRDRVQVVVFAHTNDGAG